MPRPTRELYALLGGELSNESWEQEQKRLLKEHSQWPKERVTYSEDLLLKENSLGDIGLEFGLGSGRVAAKELRARRQLEQLALAVDQRVVLAYGRLEGVRTEDQEVRDN